MKYALLLSIVLVTLLSGQHISAANDCTSQPSLCAENQCCVVIGNHGRCFDRPEETNYCKLNMVQHRTIQHAYTNGCPCAGQSKCTAISRGSGKATIGQCKA
ncbi:hypothetical protein BDF22DRAFT_670745 [Syncephalis plumigaleata]|nr:hypothetical protein BDF22DRAFT_670745 [Syncephalis plumigaleata]